MRGRDFTDVFGYGMAGITMLVWLVPVFFGAFGAIYLINFWQGQKSGRPEPMLGGKVVLSLVFSIGLELFVLGLTFFAYALFEGIKFKENLKVSGGFLCGGAIIAIYGAAIYASRASRARIGGTHKVFRQALGLNAGFTGLVFGASLTISLTMIFNDAKVTSFPNATTIVYFLAHISCILPLLGDGGYDPFSFERSRQGGGSAGDAGGVTLSVTGTGGGSERAVGGARLHDLKRTEQEQKTSNDPANPYGAPE